MLLTQRKALRRALHTVKPLYRVTELAAMCGISERRMYRLLRKKGVVMDEVQRRSAGVVTLVALREAFPELWESMMLARMVNGTSP